MRQTTRLIALIAVSAGLATRPTAASASPEVAVQSSFAAGTVLAEPAVATTTFSAIGTEYAGGPPPLEQLTVALPAGTAETETAFATCTPEVIERTGPKACKAESSAGPDGSGEFDVSFGGERDDEQVTVETFFSPGNKITVFIDGHSPTSLEILGSGSWETQPSPLGPALRIELPLTSTVPGAPYASMRQLTLELGEPQSPSLIAVAPECPTGSFTWAADGVFAREGNKETPETLIAQNHTVCPPQSPLKIAEAAKKKLEEEAAKKKAEEETAKKRLEEALQKVTILHGKSAGLAHLLKANRARLSFTSPTAGTLSITWYALAKPARHGRKAVRVPVASGHATFTKPGTKIITVRLSGRGRSLLRARKTFKLTARGTFTPTTTPIVVSGSFGLTH